MVLKVDFYGLCGEMRRSEVIKFMVPLVGATSTLQRLQFIFAAGTAKFDCSPLTLENACT